MTRWVVDIILLDWLSSWNLDGIGWAWQVMDGRRNDSILFLIIEPTFFCFFVNLLTWSLLILLAILTQLLLKLAIHFFEVLVFELFLDISKLGVISQKFFGIWHIVKFRSWIIVESSLGFILDLVFKWSENGVLVSFFCWLLPG